MDRLKRYLICVVLLVTTSCLLVGCNTVEGAGKDIESAGEGIQDLAD